MKNEEKRIKLVILTNDFLVGGVQKLVVDQATMLDRTKYDITVISLIQFPDKGNFYDLLPSDVHVIKLNFSGLFSVSEWRKLYRILRTINPDIVKSALFFSNTIARLLKPFFSFVVVAAEHNTEVARKKRYIIMNWLLAPLSKTIVADSETVANFVSSSEGISRKRFTVIYNGVELEKISAAKTEWQPHRAEILKEIGLPAHEPVFLNVARLTAAKDIALAIESWNVLKTQSSVANLVIIGDGPQYQALAKKIAEYQLEDRVKLLGERRDIYRFYACADYYLLTSQREGFCIAAMSALAFGVPLISTRVAGVIEYLVEGVSGYFVDSTPASVSAAVSRCLLLSPEERAVLQKNGLETAARFSTRAYAERYDRLFSELARRP